MQRPCTKELVLQPDAHLCSGSMWQWIRTSGTARTEV